MGRKKKRAIKPWCWYCNREFEDEKILIQHQKAKHFKCHICHKKLFTGPGLAIHCMQVHKETIDKIPAALPGKDSVEIEVYGMEGIPDDGTSDETLAKVSKPMTTASIPSPLQPPLTAFPMLPPGMPPMMPGFPPLPPPGAVVPPFMPPFMPGSHLPPRMLPPVPMMAAPTSNAVTAATISGVPMPPVVGARPSLTPKPPPPSNHIPNPPPPSTSAVSATPQPTATAAVPVAFPAYSNNGTDATSKSAHITEQKAPLDSPSAVALTNPATTTTTTIVHKLGSKTQLMHIDDTISMEERLALLKGVM
ncbi:unnamed protein product [Anisakis simplex]|uniref:Zinc finger protein 207 n=1 Tax=Anisakis simplex TaxID=6269 RepID=A0A0M3K0Q2_ANISI|nr:unnamed protein product [Anisakis simplex]